MRRLVLLVAPLLLLALPGPATAQVTTLDAAARALRNDPVYVDPAAERARDVAADRIRERIRRGNTPIFVAVLPAAAAAETGGEAGRLPEALARQVGLRGTYAVLAGGSFRAASNVLPTGRAGELATAAFQSRSPDGPSAVFETFVDRVNSAAASAGSPNPRPEPEAEGGAESPGGGGGAVLLLLALGGGGLFLWSRSRRRQERQVETKEFEADRQVLQAELSVLGSDVMELEPHVTMHPDARADYDAGVTRYRSAEAALEYADDQVDLVRVERVIDEGRYAMDRARARIEGREAPPPPDKLTRRGRHDEPALDLDERGAPVYVGYGGMPWYGGGWFGGGGGLLTGLMLGGMLGGGWGGAWGGHDHGSGDSGDPGHEAAGDWDGGGGDWGGGDFGGGDFGGGDFGGGDF